MKLEDFDYDLPRELIAQVPARERTASRLLHLDGASGALEDLTFPDIVALVQPDDTIVVNDTRVIKARRGDPVAHDINSPPPQPGWRNW